MRKTIWIEQKEKIEEIISKAEVCALAMIDTEGKPYVVMMNFGYRDGYFYFHGDHNGKKMDALRQNKEVSIFLSVDHKLVFQHENVACSYGMYYRSVSAQGRVEFIEEYEDKINALNIIMQQYTKRNFNYNPPSIHGVSVFRVKVENIRCKQFGVY
ncbi:MAG TPA: pyridoxamine 5'-phosphate oxidase family protein [Salinivirgaceae bacterium]|nr:pyridoxamine 5'-phosphate oxidase family protein [Salinivirgaceae bacterium]